MTEDLGRGRLWNKKIAAFIFLVHFSISCSEPGLLLQYFFFSWIDFLGTNVKRNIFGKAEEPRGGAAAAAEGRFQSRRPLGHSSRF